MRRQIIKYIGIGTMTAVLCVCTHIHTPVVLHALERPGSMRLTNYAPLYLDPLEEENSGNAGAGTGSGDNSGGGTTVIDPNQQSSGAQGATGSTQDASGNAGSGTTQGENANAGSGSGTGSSDTGTGASDGNTETAGGGSSQDGEAAAGGATSGDSATSGTTDSTSGAASSYDTTPINPNPYTANVNPKDMPATGVEDLRRGVVSVILILFGIIAILISIPTLKGKRRSDC